MTQFVDPRSNPEPPVQVSREPVAHGEELREFIRLCSAGRLYDAERWIQDDRPIQAVTYRRPRKPPVMSPLRTAIRNSQLDLVLLLLSNGYRLDLEADDGISVLDEALEVRAFELVDLLLKWGADPTKVRAFNVVDTYQSTLIDRFWKMGADYTADPEFVLYLAHTANKPLYGWLRRHRSDQRLQNALDVGLLDAVMKDEDLPVHLLLWAGAEPHRKVPTADQLGRPDAWDELAVFSPAEAAILFGRHGYFDALRVGAMPDLEAQFRWAHDSWTLKELLSFRLPADWSEIILAFIGQLWRPFRAGGAGMFRARLDSLLRTGAD